MLGFKFSAINASFGFMVKEISIRKKQTNKQTKLIHIWYLILIKVLLNQFEYLKKLTQISGMCVGISAQGSVPSTFVCPRCTQSSQRSDQQAAPEQASQSIPNSESATIEDSMLQEQEREQMPSKRSKASPRKKPTANQEAIIEPRPRARRSLENLPNRRKISRITPLKERPDWLFMRHVVTAIQKSVFFFLYS